jgi:hypothetical protein
MAPGAGRFNMTKALDMISTWEQGNGSWIVNPDWVGIEGGPRLFDRFQDAWDHALWLATN